MSHYLKQPLEYIKSRMPFEPEVGIVLGSGLGGLAAEIDPIATIPYSEIPDFPKSTVAGHDGLFIIGTFAGRRVMAMKGRFHYYEGYTMAQVVAPIRIMALLGVKYLFVSNACGGVNPDYAIGDLMIIRDHINLFPDNPLMGPNNEVWGPRFPDMSEAYSRELITKAHQIATAKGIPVREGVYAGLTGPCLETPAEYKYVRIIGADAVGMSTVPEVIAAHHMGITCFGMSVITDLGVQGKIVKTTHEDVVKAANKASGAMTELMAGLISEL